MYIKHRNVKPMIPEAPVPPARKNNKKLVHYVEHPVYVVTEIPPVPEGYFMYYYNHWYGQDGYDISEHRNMNSQCIIVTDYDILEHIKPNKRGKRTADGDSIFLRYDMEADSNMLSISYKGNKKELLFH